MIREATAADAGAIASIYNHYILETFISFEETPLSDQAMAERVARVQTNGCNWLVAEAQGRIVGYAYSSPWNDRAAYRHSVEISVYLDSAHSGNGWGTKLYEQLFDTLRGQNVHTAIAGIALPNPASVALHEKFGMQKVAHFREVGNKFGQWLDVGYWQSSPED